VRRRDAELWEEQTSSRCGRMRDKTPRGSTESLGKPISASGERGEGISAGQGRGAITAATSAEPLGRRACVCVCVSGPSLYPPLVSKQQYRVSCSPIVSSRFVSFRFNCSLGSACTPSAATRGGRGGKGDEMITMNSFSARREKGWMASERASSLTCSAH
jgi:hypothetical protein